VLSHTQTHTHSSRTHTHSLRAERAKDKTKEGLRELKNGIKGLFTHRSKDDSHVLRPDAGEDHGPMLASRLPPRPSTPP